MISEQARTEATPPHIEAVLAAYITPLLPGTTVSGPHSGSISPTLPVCYDTKYRLRVRIYPDREQYLVFERILPFSEEERLFIEGIVRETHAAGPAGRENLCRRMADAVTRAVSRFAAPELSETAWRVINTYATWGEQRQVNLSHTTGIRLVRQRQTRSNFFDLAANGPVKTPGSSLGAMVVIDAKGGIIGIEKAVAAPADRRGSEVLAPLMHMDIAAWASSRRRVAVSLAEDGSILLFSGSRLLFARRGAYWHSLPHTLINIENLPESIDGIAPETVKAVYLTALDTAMGTGAARIDLIRNSRRKNLPARLRRAGRTFAAGTSSISAQLLASMPDTGKFHEIPRVIRAEICALGCVLFLDGLGNILGLCSPVEKRRAGDTKHAIHKDTGNTLPERACMELFNAGGQFNLQLTIY